MSCAFCKATPAYAAQSPSYSYNCLECDLQGGIQHHIRYYAHQMPCKCGHYGTRVVHHQVAACYGCILSRNLHYMVYTPDGPVLVRSSMRTSYIAHTYGKVTDIRCDGKPLNPDGTFGDQDVMPYSTLTYVVEERDCDGTADH